MAYSDMYCSHSMGTIRTLEDDKMKSQCYGLKSIALS